MKGRYTATKKGVKKGYRILKDKAKVLKKSVTCKAKQAKSFAKKQIQNAKAQINKAKRTLKSKVSNAVVSVKKNLPKIGMAALKGVSNALTTIPGIRNISAAIGATRAAQSLKSDLYNWADKITSGFEPSAAMKLQMEQNYTAYLQNNSTYRSSKDYQNAFRNKTLRDDLEIIEAQANIVFIFSGASEKPSGMSFKTYNKYLNASVHNKGSSTAMLGKYGNGGSESYIVKAGKKHEYFSLGDDWAKIQKKYQLKDSDMFEMFNKPFLDNAIKEKKVFYFSHDPRNEAGALRQEYNYLIKHGYQYIPDSMMMKKMS